MTYQLSFDNAIDRWILRELKPRSLDEDSFEMHIRYRGGGEFEYHFIMWQEGEMYVCLTPDEYKKCLKDIAEHEGPDMAAIWEVGQDTYLMQHADHPVFALRKYWEAMITLNLFVVSPNHYEWRFKPLPPAVQKQMAELRERQMQEGADEMAAAQQDGEKGKGNG
jgi:hypothetical protein